MAALVELDGRGLEDERAEVARPRHRRFAVVGGGEREPALLDRRVLVVGARRALPQQRQAQLRADARWNASSLCPASPSRSVPRKRTCRSPSRSTASARTSAAASEPLSDDACEPKISRRPDRASAAARCARWRRRTATTWRDKRSAPRGNSSRAGARRSSAERGRTGAWAARGAGAARTAGGASGGGGRGGMRRLGALAQLRRLGRLRFHRACGEGEWRLRLGRGPRTAAAAARASLDFIAHRPAPPQRCARSSSIRRSTSVTSPAVRGGVAELAHRNCGAVAPAARSPRRQGSAAALNAGLCGVGLGAAPPTATACACASRHAQRLRVADATRRSAAPVCRADFFAHPAQRRQPASTRSSTGRQPLPRRRPASGGMKHEVATTAEAACRIGRAPTRRPTMSMSPASRGGSRAPDRRKDLGPAPAERAGRSARRCCSRRRRAEARHRATYVGTASRATVPRPRRT